MQQVPPPASLGHTRRGKSHHVSALRCRPLAAFAERAQRGHGLGETVNDAATIEATDFFYVRLDRLNNKIAPMSNDVEATHLS